MMNRSGATLTALLAAALLAGTADAPRAETNLAGGSGLLEVHSVGSLPAGTLGVGLWGDYLEYTVGRDPRRYRIRPTLTWAPSAGIEVMLTAPVTGDDASGSWERGLGDGTFGLKYSPHPNIATLLTANVPHLSAEEKGLTNGRVDLTFAGIVSVPLGPARADLNVGYRASGIATEGGDDRLVFGGGLSLPIRGSVTPFVEVSGSKPVHGTRATTQALAGVRFSAPGGFAVTAGAGTRLQGDGVEAPDRRFILGVTWSNAERLREEAAAAEAAAALAAKAPKAPAPAPVAAAPQPTPPPPAPKPEAPAPAPAPPVATPTPAPPPPPAPKVAVPPAPAAPAIDPDLEDAKRRILATSFLFDRDDAEFSPEAKKALDAVVADLKRHPSIRLAVEGHTDSRGSASYNRVLGKRRARSVMDYFLAAGIGSDRLVAVSQGEMKPVADNKTKEGRARNRRVVFQILP